MCQVWGSPTYIDTEFMLPFASKYIPLRRQQGSSIRATSGGACDWSRPLSTRIAIAWLPHGYASRFIQCVPTPKLQKSFGLLHCPNSSPYDSACRCTCIWPAVPDTRSRRSARHDQRDGAVLLEDFASQVPSPKHHTPNSRAACFSLPNPPPDVRPGPTRRQDTAKGGELVQR